MQKLKVCTFGLQLLLLVICASLCQAQESFPAHELKFQHVFGTKVGDPTLYAFLGCGWIRPLTTGTHEIFVKRWIEDHPNAVATPISEMNGLRMGGKRPTHLVYIWIEDGRESLNVALIRDGIFPGGVMIDMVDAEQRLSEVLLDPRLADARAQIERERAARPLADRPKRLVPEANYAERMKQIIAAESEAREHKKGIWSDKYRDLREAEGM